MSVLYFFILQLFSFFLSPTKSFTIICCLFLTSNVLFLLYAFIVNNLRHWEKRMKEAIKNQIKLSFDKNSKHAAWWNKQTVLYIEW